MVEIISSLKEFEDFCNRASREPYITIDTEFIRDRTYYPKLCLIQIAFRGSNKVNAAIIDAQSSDINLQPLYDLFDNNEVVKVFHAARQDLEIFFSNAQIFPKPFFDTQVAAMVCGFGEQVAYETLVRKLLSVDLDKSSRFTDWSQRPLSEKQINYAISDVTHLRSVYEELKKRLDENGRAKWVEEELSILTNPKTYNWSVDEAWKKIKVRNKNPFFLSFVKTLAMFRETEARSRNIPRNRILKDEMILELAALKPKNGFDLKKSRLLHEDAKRGWLRDGIISAIKNTSKLTASELNELSSSQKRSIHIEGLRELLRVLLKIKSDETGVAQKLIATNHDLDEIACADYNDVSVLKGWRKKIFGDDAMRLKNGEIGLSVAEDGLKIIELNKKTN